MCLFLLGLGTLCGAVEEHDPDFELRSFKVATGYEASLFAAEPMVVKPIQMQFDPRGRLWVLCTSVYPQIKPGEAPADKLVILEDTDGDGRADKSTDFATGLTIPTGLALGDGGAYVGHGTELIHLRDHDGDDKADERRVILSGFGTGDSHQNINSFVWSPGGELIFSQGANAYSRVETLHGLKALDGPAFWRWRPRLQSLQGFFNERAGPANPWGNVFDFWGQPFMADGCCHGLFYLLPAMAMNHGEVRFRGERYEGIWNSKKICGIDILSGRAFPEEAQGVIVGGTFFVNSVSRWRVVDAGAGFAAEELPPLIESTNRFFRVVDVKVGLDGAIYLADWYNPIVGHYQYSLRHPDRDKSHGRIWRVAARNRPRLAPPKLVGLPLEALLDYLKAPENATRYQVKRLLDNQPTDQVTAALSRWIESLSPADPGYQHHLVEGLGVYETHEVVEPNLLKKLLRAEDFRARAYATRVVGQWGPRLNSPLELLGPQVNDPHPRVRLEAVIALSHFPELRAFELAMGAADHPMDRFLEYALQRLVKGFKPYWEKPFREGQLTLGTSPKQMETLIRADASLASLQPIVTLLKSGRLSPDAREPLLELLARLGQAREMRFLLSREPYTSPAGYDAKLHARTLARLGRLIPATRADSASLRGGVELVPGKFGQAVKLDGRSGYVECPSSPLFNTSTLSLEFWMKPDGSNLQQQFPLTRGNNDPWTVQIQAASSATAPRELRWIVQGQVVASASVRPDRWQHIAIVHSASSGRIYVDGNETSQFLRGTSLRAEQPNEPIRVGRRQGLEHFQGLIDDVAMFNRELSRELIRKHMTEGVTVSDSNPALLLWTFDADTVSGTLVKSTAASFSELLPLLRELLAQPHEELRAEAIKLAGALRQSALSRQVLNLAESATSSEGIRRAAIEAMSLFGDGESRDALRRLGAAGQPAPTRFAAIAALASIDLTAAAAQAAAALSDPPGSTDPAELFGAFLNRRGGAEALGSALRSKPPEADAAKLGLRVLQSAGRQEAGLLEVLRNSAGLTGEAREWTPAEIAALARETQLQGDPHRGQSLFLRADLNCVACHSIGENGSRIGPDLAAIGAGQPVDFIIGAVLYPNREIKEGYVSYSITTRDGEAYQGYKLNEDREELLFHDGLQGREIRIRKSQIEEQRPMGSLMPTGLVDPLTRAELRDLFRFLSELGKPGPFATIAVRPGEKSRGVPLFNGHDFTGWEGDTNLTFRIEAGSIVAGSTKAPIPRNEFLCTTREFTNFVLRAKCRLFGEQPNAGIQFRSRRVPNDSEVSGYQADMGERGLWGSLYDESRRNRMLAVCNLDAMKGQTRRDDWKDYVIRCEGSRIQLWVNGIQTVDYVEPDASIPRSGIIGLQVHGGKPMEAWYKDITIEELP